MGKAKAGKAPPTSPKATNDLRRFYTSKKPSSTAEAAAPAAAEPSVPDKKGEAGAGKAAPQQSKPAQASKASSSPANRPSSSSAAADRANGKAAAASKAAGSAAKSPGAKRSRKRGRNDDAHEDEEDIVVNLAGDESSQDTEPMVTEEVTPRRQGRKAAAKRATKGEQAPSVQKPQEDGDAGKEKPAAKKRKTPAKKTTTPGEGAAKTPAKRKHRPTGIDALQKKEEDLAPDVAAAVAGVDAACAQLPADEELELTFVEPGAGGGGGDVEPPNHGSQTYPNGHPECLHGKKFVITGTLDSMWRHEAEEYIKRHSGKVTGSVSGATTHLICGSNAGTSKVTTAKAKGTRLITEEGLLAMVAAALAPNSQPGLSAKEEKASELQAAAAQASGVRRPPKAAQASGAGPSAAAAAPAPGAADAAGQLWVEKHKPQTSQQLVGNQAAIGRLRNWLRTWEGIFIKGQAAPEGRSAKDAMQKKACLLAGPPGIGKTSSAQIIARELGYTAVEVNASDTRNKSDKSALKGMGGKLSNAIREMVTSKSLVGANGQPKKMVLIMDEVDGMSAGDRGGVTELIETIKRSKVPIIAICNDKYAQKLKSLRNHCNELDYRKPMRDAVTKRMRDVARAEGLHILDNALNELAEGANCDVRLVLGQLQMIRRRSTAASFDDVKRGRLGASKDADMSPFTVAQNLLSPASQHLSLGDKMSQVMGDMDLVPLLIQENYLNHRPMLAATADARLKIAAKAAEAFSDGDLVNRRLRQYQNWSLMPFAAVVSGVLPSSYVRGGRESFQLYPNEPNFGRFTSWLGQNSSASKQRRLLGELHTRMLGSGNLYADRLAVRTSYLPVLRRTLLKPLIEQEKDGIEPVVQQMHAYGMAREDIDFMVDVTKFKTKEPWADDPMKGVPTATKSAFTRYFNQHLARPRTTTQVEGFTKRKGKREAAAEPADEGDEPLDPDRQPDAAGSPGAGRQEEEEDEEEDALDPAVLAKKAKQLGRRGVSFSAREPKGAKAKKAAGGARGGVSKPAGGRGAKGQGAGAAARKGRGKS